MMATTAREGLPTIRLTAAKRRDAIIDVAMHEFTLGVFDGTPAAVIALRAGVSQPYLFALFGTKRNLFIAAVKRGFEQMRSLILLAAREEGAAGDALNGVRTVLLSLRQQRTLLLLQLHAFAACADPGVRAVTRAEFEETRRVLASVSGASDGLLRPVLDEQAMVSVAAVIGLPEARS